MTTRAPLPFVGIDQEPDGCWMACLASLTRIPLAEFPKVPGHELSREQESDLVNAVNRLLRSHGWQLHALWSHPEAIPQGWALAGGPGPRGLEHWTVTYDGQLVWDPHPSRLGLVSTTNYMVLIPTRAGNRLPDEP